MIVYTISDNGHNPPEVMCCACLKPLGTFNRVVLLKALLSHGDLLCPDCRLRHCQFCGWVDKEKPVILTSVLEVNGKPYRICSLCTTTRAGDTINEPRCVWTVANVRPKALGESLSSIS